MDEKALKIKKSLLLAIENQAEESYPYECCGLLLGHFTKNGSEAFEYVPLENTKEENRKRRFLIDQGEYQRIEDRADEKGQSIVSIVHSHPDHPDKPSQFDQDHAWPGLSYIIVSVMKGKAKSLSSWQLKNNRSSFTQEKINTWEH